MSETPQQRAAALLASPAGCTLLLMLDEHEAPLADLADPEVGLHAIAQAVGEIIPWSGNYDRILRTVFDYRDQHRERLEQLALDLVSQPGIEWMWAGVDLDNQLWLPQESGWVDRESFLAGRNGTAGDWADPYAHEPRPLLCTSNRYGDISPELAHIASGMGDWNLEPPLPRRHVAIRPGVRILEIGTPRDWHGFVLRYPANGDHATSPDDPDKPWGRAVGLLVPDWRAAAADWDGVHISPWAYLTTIQMRVESDAGWTEPWAWEGPHMVWLDWVFASVEKLPPMRDYPRSADSLNRPLQALNFSDYSGSMVVSMTDEADVEALPMPAANRSFSIGRGMFGEIDGETVERITLTNSHGLSLSVLSYGGIIQALQVPDRFGDRVNVSLGFDTLEEYIEKSPYFGAIVGRFANRIANGRFTLDGRDYAVPVNNGPNSLHGGIQGFDKHIWTVDLNPHPQTCSVTFRRTSPDGEEGYPGTVDVAVTYTLDTSAAAFSIDYVATADAPTVLNLSNHSYFNLAGAGTGDILRHVIQLRAGRYLPVNAHMIPTGEIASVTSTPFDFTEARVIGERIDTPGNEQLARAGGYDHCYVLDTFDDLGFQPAWQARVVDPGSGRVMDVQTDQPGVQFYTGNFLDGSFVGTGGHIYGHRAGFCLETQHFPNSPNEPSFPPTELRPGETFRSQTRFSFGVLPDGTQDRS